MTAAILISTAIASGIVLLQTNVLANLALSGVRPDLIIILIVYFSNANGSLPGQLTGFAAGVVLDLVTLAPIGFHSLIYATIGFVYGATKDKVFIDPILVPMLMVLVATVLKGLLGSLLGIIFGLGNVLPSIWSSAFLIEAGMNSLLAPLVFALFRMIKPLKIRVPGSQT